MKIAPQVSAISNYDNYDPLRVNGVQNGKRISYYVPHDHFLKLKEDRLTSIKTFNNDNILDKYAKFLREQEWDYYCTFTTRKAISLGAARRVMEKLALNIGCSGNYTFVEEYKKGEKYTKSYDIPGFGESMLFWAAEPFKIRDGYHMHSLIKCNLTKEQLFTYWHEKYGRNHVKKYDEERPGCEYVSKYFTKQLSDYDLHF